jgi:large subunit ribosomal protein L13e
MVERKDGKMCIGKGFSKSELKEAGVDFKQALRLAIPVDLRRKTRHEENIDALRRHLSLLVPKISKPPKPSKKIVEPMKAKVTEQKPTKPIKPTKKEKKTEVSKLKRAKAPKAEKPTPKKSPKRRKAKESKRAETV